METRAFAPLYKKASGSTGGTLSPSVTIAATTSAVAGILPGNSTGNQSFCQIQIANTTNGWAYVNFGNSQVAAVTAATVATGYPVAPGAVVVVSVDGEINVMSVILASGSTGGSVTFTRGEGL